MTKQEIFDRVATHLLTQNKRSVSDAGNCLYRGPQGLRCAVGCLFPDSYDTSEIEGNDSGEHCVVEPLVALGILSQEDFDLYSSVREGWRLTASNMLRSLQYVHDSYDVECWREQLEEVAERHNLTFNPPKST